MQHHNIFHHKLAKILVFCQLIARYDVLLPECLRQHYFLSLLIIDNTSMSELHSSSNTWNDLKI